MYSCPACGTEDVAARANCLCGADLTLLRRLDEIADAWFNRGLEAASAGAPGRALEWLSACCVARPTDAAARRAQAKVWAQLGCRAAAEDALARAAAIEPDAPELAVLRQALQEQTQPRPVTPGASKKKRKKKARGGKPK
jgi:tetratricopeptide (TPR) repeat protein